MFVQLRGKLAAARDVMSTQLFGNLGSFHNLGLGFVSAASDHLFPVEDGQGHCTAAQPCPHRESSPT